MKDKLKDFDQTQVDVFIDYVTRLKTEKQKNYKTQQWESKNPWATKKGDDWFISLFKKNSLTGLILDGIHVTIQNTGLCYDYMAYKQKMFNSYPKTKFDFSEVYEGDSFNFKKVDGRVQYTHEFANPFEKDYSKIIGLYCVIKNERGEFLTLLNQEEVKKHRLVAKTDKIWSQWTLEMMYKTVIKKATKIHFEDEFKDLNDEDNKAIDLDQPVDIEIELKQKVEAIETINDLQKFYMDNKDKQDNKKSFNAIINKRKQELKQNEDS